MDNKELLDIYLKGFNDELDSNIYYVKENELISKIYNLGRDHALIGDDIRSVDYLNNEQISNMIYKILLKDIKELTLKYPNE